MISYILFKVLFKISGDSILKFPSVLFFYSTNLTILYYKSFFPIFISKVSESRKLGLFI